MKLTTKIAAGVFALALFGGALVGCSNSSDGFSLADLEKLRKPGNNQGKTSASVVLLEDSEGWTTDWDTKTFEADKFAKAVSGSKFKFTVSKNTDQYRTGTEGNYDYSNCYSIIQLLDGEDKLVGGTIEDGEIEVARGNLKPEYLLANGDPDYDESHVFTMIYTPSDAEIAILKTRGVGIQAHGTKIFKIEFVSSSGGNQQEENQETATVVWTGSTVIGWDIAESGEYIDANNDKLVNAKGLRVTYTTGDGTSPCFKFLQGNTWEDITLASVTGAGTLANSGSDTGKAVWLENDTTDAVVSIYWTAGSEDETKVLSGGIKVYGDGATLTKIEVLR